MPAATKARAVAGPALFRAAMPVRTKMPVPMMTPTPNTVRSQAESDFRSACSGSSVSRMDCSTVLVRKGLFRSLLTDAPPKGVDARERAGRPTPQE